jgi:hypothetical protein
LFFALYFSAPAEALVFVLYFLAPLLELLPVSRPKSG